MKKTSLALLLAFFLAPLSSHAHFVELTPDLNFIDDQTGKDISLHMSFTHPFENGPLMKMDRPKEFGVLHKGKKTDLLAQLKETKGFAGLKWETQHRLNRLGDYIFYVTPVPYFEPAEGKFIVHYTKTVISHAGGDHWDDLVGQPVEIRPLTRPYGLWTNNLFRGVVLNKGQPVPFATIEIEHKNEQQITAPNDSFITQVIKADADGVFVYALPKSGWWGFAALIEDGETLLGDDGQAYPIEKGALIWVKAQDMK